MEEFKAWLDDFYCVQLEGPSLRERLNDVENAYAKWNGNEIKLIKEDYANGEKVHFFSRELMPVGEDIILDAGDISVSINHRNIVRTEMFEKKYDASDEDLGYTYSEKETTFRVWSPIASKMELKIKGATRLMNKTETGVWEYTEQGDCHGSTYLFMPTINGEVCQVVDPYAKALTTNGEEGVVVDLIRTDPTDFRTTPRPSIDHLQDCSIYELHIRDATVHENSGIVDKGKYLGLTERDTNTTGEYSSGLAYIKELGISHVQLLPVNDFARVDDEQPDQNYNWGYDPLFFQVPEGSYSVDPTDPLSRISELKELVKAFHQEGLSLILDVVYNHVFIMEESPFERLVPGYYFRYHDNGKVSNGTGVGNDIATEKTMVRKFILDTIKYWLKEYQVDGFRFDLMGAIDITTMKEIQTYCEQEETPVMLLGEGWELPTAFPAENLATSFQSHRLPGVRFFNDVFRDSIKGNLFDFQDYGFANGEGRYIERMPQLVKGSVSRHENIPPFVHDVVQTINYVECHDNHTLWDRLSIANKSLTKEERKKVQKIATGLTVVSQGIPFIHAGQEWFRTKKGDGNSYISGDEVNQLNWKDRETEKEHIEFVKELLKIRKKYPVFRMTSREAINRSLHILQTPSQVFGFTLLDHKHDFCIYVNPTKAEYKLNLPSSGMWKMIATNIAESGKRMLTITGAQCTVEPFEFFIIKKSRL